MPRDASRAGCPREAPGTLKFLSEPLPAVGTGSEKGFEGGSRPHTPENYPLPEAEQGQSCSRSPSRAQQACGPGPWQLAWHVPDRVSLKADVLVLQEASGLSEGSEGAGPPCPWDVQTLMPLSVRACLCVHLPMPPC